MLPPGPRPSGTDRRCYPPAVVALVVILALTVSTLALLGVLVVGLFRHLRLLSGSLERFRAEVTPLLEEIRSSSAGAQERADALAERRSKPGGDARIRL